MVSKSRRFSDLMVATKAAAVGLSRR